MALQPDQQQPEHQERAQASMARVLGAMALDDFDESIATADLAYLVQVLGHEPRGWWRVVARDEQGRARVVVTYPLWCVGKMCRPFPNLFWLTDADLISRISELERVGTIGLLEESLAADAAFRAKVDDDHARYAAMRWAMLDEQDRRLAESMGFSDAIKARGVGGLTAGSLKIKCLHAHVAHELAMGQQDGNEVGRRVLGLLEAGAK